MKYNFNTTKQSFSHFLRANKGFIIAFVFITSGMTSLKSFSNELSSAFGESKAVIEAAIVSYDNHEIKPDSADVWYAKGNAARENYQYYEAMEYYKIAIELNPSLVDAYVKLGDVYPICMGDFYGAIVCYESAIKLNPNSADAYAGLGLAYQYGERDYDKAIKFYDKAIKLNPNLADVYIRLGAVYLYDKQDYNNAIKCYKKAIELNPDQIDLYYTLGEVYFELGDKDKAIECLKKIAQLGDEDAQELLRDNNVSW